MAATPAAVRKEHPLAAAGALRGRTDAVVASATWARDAGRARLDALDAARAAFVLLGVLFHASLPYHREGYWIVDDPSHSTLLTSLAALLHSFRMPGFFLIAGILSELAYREATRNQFLWRRTLRLAIPMLLTLVTCNVLQYHVLAHFAASCVDDGACTAADPHAAIGLGHLWFLAVLLVATAIYWSIRSLLVRAADRLIAACACFGDGVAGWLVLASFAAGYAAWEIGSLALQKIPGVGTDWFGFSVPALLYGFFFFVAGVMVARSGSLLGRLQRVPAARTILALLLTGTACLAIAGHLAGASSLPVRVSEVALRALATACNVVGAIYLSTLAFRRFEAPLRFMGRHAYPVYLVHQCLVVCAALMVASAPVPALAKFTVVVTFALATAFLLAIVLERSPAWAHHAVGGRRETARSRSTERRTFPITESPRVAS